MDTSETYEWYNDPVFIKMCEKSEIQKEWMPTDGDFFATSTSSLSYAYGGMRDDGDVWRDEDSKPKPFNISDCTVDVLTDQEVDSGYYGWGIGESFPKKDERDILSEYFVWLPRQDQLQKMVKRGNNELYPHSLLWRFMRFVLGDNGIKIDGWGEAMQYVTSMEQLWLAFVMKTRWNKVWNGEDWVNGK